jgi:glucose/arabinose dehydrogenase
MNVNDNREVQDTSYGKVYVTKLKTLQSRIWSMIKFRTGTLVSEGTTPSIAYIEKYVSRLTGLPDDISTDGHGGILDLLCYNDCLYYTYTDTSYRLVCVRAEVSESLHLTNEIIFRGTCRTKPFHYGGRLAIYNNHLIVSTGDGYTDETQAQNIDNEFGTIMSIDLNTLMVKYIVIGIRNVQGLLVKDDTLWMTDHGLRGADLLYKVDLIRNRRYNFGWGAINRSVDDITQKIPSNFVPCNQSTPNFDTPYYKFLVTIAPSSLNIIPPSDNTPKQWYNNLVVTGLRSERLLRIVVNDNYPCPVHAEEIMPFRIGRIRSTYIDEDRFLIGTDDGSIYSLNVKEELNFA